MVANETNTYSAFSHRKSGVNDSNWKETNAEEADAYIGSDQLCEYYGVGRSTKMWWAFVFYFKCMYCE